MYAYLSEVEYDASGVLRLTLGGARVEIRGVNLAPLYEKLLAHRITHVMETPSSSLNERSLGCPFIESIIFHVEDPTRTQ